MGVEDMTKPFLEKYFLVKKSFRITSKNYSIFKTILIFPNILFKILRIASNFIVQPLQSLRNGPTVSLAYHVFVNKSLNTRVNKIEEVVFSAGAANP